MLKVNKIVLTQFKNYEAQTFSFSENVVAICGPNGTGKTNLLDAIYYSCFTKSYFGQLDATLTCFHKDGFRIETEFQKENENHSILCIYRSMGKKTFFWDHQLYEKLSQHIGKMPAVMVAPDDTNLITGGSEGRRKFLDALLSQIDPVYLHHLILYNKILAQRNSLLKQFAMQAKVDESLLEILNQQWLEPANYIYQKRTQFCKTLKEKVESLYNQLSGKKENIVFQYESPLQIDDFSTLLKTHRHRDGILQRSTMGIHKDDLKLEMDGQPFKQIASQGQRKSMLFALKLAEFELLKFHKSLSPLLLLDDVFEKLDEARMKQLLRWVCVENQGQVFITDTHENRLQQAFSSLNIPFQVIHTFA